jgi:hypothetical protein
LSGRQEHTCIKEGTSFDSICQYLADTGAQAAPHSSRAFPTGSGALAMHSDLKMFNYGNNGTLYIAQKSC